MPTSTKTISRPSRKGQAPSNFPSIVKWDCVFFSFVIRLLPVLSAGDDLNIYYSLFIPFTHLSIKYQEEEKVWWVIDLIQRRWKKLDEYHFETWGSGGILFDLIWKRKEANFWGNREQSRIGIGKYHPSGHVLNFMK